MGKSKRKHKIFGNCGGSEKKDKRLCNRSLRRKTRLKIKVDDLDSPFPIADEVMNKWSMVKDGKHYWKDADEKDMRK